MMLSKIYILILVLLLMIPFSLAQNEVYDTDVDLIAWFKLDDSSTTHYLDSKDNNIDTISLSIGDGDPEETQSALTSFSTNSIKFNSDIAWNVTATAYPILKSMNNVAGLTFGCFFQVSAGTDDVMYGWLDTDGATRSGIHIAHYDGGGGENYWLEWAQSGGLSTLDSTYGVTNGETLSVVGRVNSSDKTIFISGVQTATSVSGVALDYGTNPPLIIGGNYWNDAFGKQMNGFVDDCFIINRSLTDAEILEWNSSGIQSSNLAPVVTWNNLSLDNKTVTADDPIRMFFNVTDSESDPVACTFFQNGTNSSSSSTITLGSPESNFTFDTPPNGVNDYEFYVDCHDASSHSNSTKKTIYSDTKNPVITWNAISPQQPINDNSSNITSDFNLKVQIDDDHLKDVFWNITYPNSTIVYNNQSLNLHAPQKKQYNITDRVNTSAFGVSRYIVTVEACDSPNNCLVESREFHFDNQVPLFLTLPGNFDTTNLSSIINWTNDESTNFSLSYGLCPAFSLSIANASKTAVHNPALSGLSNSSLYCVNVSVWDSFGNLNWTNTSFTTSANASDSETPVSSPSSETAISGGAVPVNNLAVRTCHKYSKLTWVGCVFSIRLQQLREYWWFTLLSIGLGILWSTLFLKSNQDKWFRKLNKSKRRRSL